MAQVSIDQLWRGESSQAPFKRLPGTVEHAVNVRFDVTLGGATTRNPLQLTADMGLEGEFYFCAIRDAIVAIRSDGQVSGWKIDGTTLTVSGDTLAFSQYVNWHTSTPIQKRLSHANSVDTIVVTHRSRTTGVGNAFTPQEALNYLLRGDSGDSSHGIVASVQEDVETIADLPESPSPGDLHYVTEDYELNPAGAYLYPGSGISPDYPDGYFPQHGDWYRVPSQRRGAARRGQYDAAKMPHRIVYDADAGTLTVGPIPWRQRVSGNTWTNTHMPWAGHPIHSVGFLNGRLLLVSRSHLTSSRKDDYFNLYLDNVNAVADNDRIISEVGTEGGTCLHARVIGDAVFLNFDAGQGMFWSGEETLSNVNGRFTSLTSIRTRDVAPGASNNTVAVIDQEGDIHQFRWAGVYGGGIVYSGYLTAHRRDLLYDITPRDIYLVGETTYITTEQEPLLVHDSFAVGDQIVQSAWGHYHTREPIVFLHSWHGAIHVVTQGETYSLLRYVHRPAQPPPNMQYLPPLDRLELVQPGEMTYYPEQDLTMVPHTGRAGDMEASFVVRTDPENRHYFQGAAAIDADGHPLFKGDLTVAAQYLGFAYDFSVRLSKLYPGLQANGVQMRDLVVFHDRTSAYRLRWQPQAGPEFVEECTPYQVGEAHVGRPALTSGCTKFPVIADPRHTTLTLEGRTPAVATWVALTYQANVQGQG